MSAQSSLHKIAVATNPNYKASGAKSYAHLMRKWRFEPTKPSLFYFGKKFEQQGSVAGGAVGGKVHQQTILEKKKTPGSSSQAGQVSAQDIQNDSLYLATVSIGTPPQTLRLDFDTGSADLWVWSTALPAAVKAQGKGHTIFDPSKSSTFKKSSGQSWRISYGDGSSASGTVGTDNVVIGGLTIKAQAVELATELSAEFEQDTGDGLLGLAFGAINTVQPERVQTPVENMISQEDIPKSAELFTAKLGSWRDKNEPDQGQGFYTFGYLDQATVAACGPISYAPVDSTNGFWEIQSTSAVVNGQTIQKTGTAIMDTGTTLLLTSDDVCEAIYNAIPGATYDEASQGYIFPTNLTVDQFPVVTFAIGDTQFTVQKEDLGFTMAKEGYIYGGIQSRGTSNMDIMGDTMLKGIYAIFDQGNMRFGAAQRPEKNQNVSAPPATS